MSTFQQADAQVVSPADTAAQHHSANTAAALQRILQWTETLATVDDAWRELQAEKHLGWASGAVDQMWKMREKKMMAGTERRKIPIRRSFAPSTKKYVRFYRECLPTLSETFAGRGSGGAAGDGILGDVAYSFVDIGASPGGMCEYLVRHLGWRGHAFSLSEADGGFGMAFTHARLEYTDANLAEDGSWRHLLQAVPSTFFVNAGIVVDRGQMMALYNSDDPGEGREMGWAHTVAVRSLEFGVILRNELLFALRALCKSGHLYFAYQLGIYSLLYKILLELRPAFQTVHVTSTFAAHRTPVYVFLGGYAGAESPDSLAALSFLEALPTTGDDAFTAWHVSMWDDKVAALHAELADDLHAVWGTQERLLRQQREEAERLAADGRTCELPSSSEHAFRPWP